MKNITLAVDEEVLRAVRRYASSQDVTVNRLVRDYLTQIAMREDRAAKAKKTLARLSKRSCARVGEACWSRDDVYER